eukprot:15450199-Alexandrium_andersonii.AAC.1
MPWQPAARRAGSALPHGPPAPPPPRRHGRPRPWRAAAHGHSARRQGARGTPAAATRTALRPNAHAR